MNKILILFLVIIVSFVVIEAASGISQKLPKFFQVDAANWLTRVPDDQSLADMTIPGTHDSCASYEGPISRCQTTNLTEQLNNGIRFLDIRCKVQDGNFHINHGIIYQHINFEQVLDECLQFLDTHPTEAILMSIQQEESKAPEAEFINIFDRYMNTKGYKNITYGDKIFYANGTIPILKELRGRIAIVSRVTGLRGIQWGDLDVQDDYQLHSKTDISRKWTEAQTQLEKAGKAHSQGDKKIFVNFISAVGHPFPLPDTVAEEMNKNLYSYLNETACTFGKICFYGIVPMDFPGNYDNGVIELLIQQNKINEL